MTELSISFIFWPSWLFSREKCDGTEGDGVKWFEQRIGERGGGNIEEEEEKEDEEEGEKLSFGEKETDEYIPPSFSFSFSISCSVFRWSPALTDFTVTSSNILLVLLSI